MDYNNIADAYTRHRKAIPLVLNELRRVCEVFPETQILEVGCGTGNQLTELVKATDCYGWGIDPSYKMLNHAVADEKLHFLQDSAEELPFEDGFFDLVFSINVIHHLQNTIAYFQEVLRVLKPHGIICTATDSERKIRNRKPLAEYWPATVDIDLKRYPSLAALRQQMDVVGFIDIRDYEIQEPFEVTDIAPYREKAFSCLHLISEEEYLSGLLHLEADLKVGPVQGVTEFILLWGQHP